MRFTGYFGIRARHKSYYPIGKGFEGDLERLAQDQAKVKEDMSKGTKKLRMKYPGVLDVC